MRLNKLELSIHLHSSHTRHQAGVCLIDFAVSRFSNPAKPQIVVNGTEAKKNGWDCSKAWRAVCGWYWLRGPTPDGTPAQTGKRNWRHQFNAVSIYPCLYIANHAVCFQNPDKFPSTSAFLKRRCQGLCPCFSCLRFWEWLSLVTKLKRLDIKGRNR